MEAEFNIYEFIQEVQNISPERLADIMLVPFCIMAAALCVGQLVNNLVESHLRKHFDDEENISLKYIVLKAARGLPRAWIVGTILYWLLKTVSVAPTVRDLFSYLLFAWLSFTVFQVLARAATGFIELHAQRNSNIPQISLLPNIVNVLIYSMGILFIISSMGISIAPMLTAMGIGGMAIALGLQETLTNICAGLYLLLSKQLSIDDYVRLSTGEEGRIADITWRFTTIIATSGNAIVVPNQKISSAIITNYCMPEPDMSIKVACGVSYDSDLEEVERVTIEVAKEVTKKVDATVTKEPSVFFQNFSESSIDFNVLLHCSQFTQQFKLRHEFIKALTKRYREEGIEIPYPIRTVYSYPQKPVEIVSSLMPKKKSEEMPQD